MSQNPVEEAPKTLPFAVVYRFPSEGSPVVEYDGVIFLYSLYIGAADLPDNPNEMEHLEAASRDLGLPYGFINDQRHLALPETQQLEPGDKVIVEVCHVELPIEAAQCLYLVDDLLVGFEPKTTSEQELRERFHRLREFYRAGASEIDPLHALLTAVASATPKLHLLPTIPLL